jgi:hypothetical protein
MLELVYNNEATGRGLKCRFLLPNRPIVLSRLCRYVG